MIPLKKEILINKRKNTEEKKEQLNSLPVKKLNNNGAFTNLLMNKMMIIEKIEKPEIKKIMKVSTNYWSGE